MGSLRVLLVEDDPVTKSIIGELLAVQGHAVCGEVSNGRDVSSAVKLHKPDVVLMDVHLADGVPGTAVTRNLLWEHHIPIIIISGANTPAELQAIAECGALGFLKKPVTAEELGVNLRIAINHNEAMRRISVSEVLHKNIFNAAAVGIYVCHRDGYFMTSNTAYARMLGYSGPGELLRLVKSADEQVYAQPGRRKELLGYMEAGKELHGVESEIYGKDGDLLWVSEHFAPKFDDRQGLLSHYEGVSINITARKHAENEKSVAYKLVQTTMDAIADFVVVTDLEKNIVFSNKAFERALGKVVGPERVLSFRGEPSCPVERFYAELCTPKPADYQVRGYCTIDGYNEMLSVGITRYEAPGAGILGAVFIMHAV